MTTLKRILIPVVNAGPMTCANPNHGKRFEVAVDEPSYLDNLAQAWCWRCAEHLADAETLAEVLFNAYGDAVCWQAVSGPMPRWADVVANPEREKVRLGWHTVARRAASLYRPGMPLLRGDTPPFKRARWYTLTEASRRGGLGELWQLLKDCDVANEEAVRAAIELLLAPEVVPATLDTTAGPPAYAFDQPDPPSDDRLYSIAASTIRGRLEMTLSQAEIDSTIKAIARELRRQWEDGRRPAWGSVGFEAKDGDLAAGKAAIEETASRILREGTPRGEELTEPALVARVLSDGDWQSAAWLLARRYPERWGEMREIGAGVPLSPKRSLLLDEQAQIEAIVDALAPFGEDVGAADAPYTLAGALMIARRLRKAREERAAVIEKAAAPLVRRFVLDEHTDKRLGLELINGCFNGPVELPELLYALSELGADPKNVDATLALAAEIQDTRKRTGSIQHAIQRIQAKLADETHAP
jgi:hypothetical protein